MIVDHMVANEFTPT